MDGFQSTLSLAHIPPLNLFTSVLKLHALFQQKKGCLNTCILPTQFSLPIDTPPSTPKAASLSLLSTFSPLTTLSASTHYNTSALPGLPQWPKSLPFAATDENIPILEQYLLEQFCNTTFNNSI